MLITKMFTVRRDIISFVAILVHYRFKTIHIFVTSLCGCKFVRKGGKGNPQTLTWPAFKMKTTQYNVSITIIKDNRQIPI